MRVLLLAIFILLNLPAQTAHAQSCPNGNVDIGADRELATIAGIPSNVTCWDPNSADTGRSAAEAKKYLMEHTKIDKSRIICLNSKFAVDLQKFMARVPGGPPTITGAYRTQQEQAKIIGTSATKVTTPCGSYHPWGLAVDFNNGADQQKINWMRANYNGSGLATIGDWDPGHFQSANGRGGQCGQCGASGVGDTSTGGLQSTGGGAAPFMPFQNLMSPFQNLFAPNTMNPTVPQINTPGTDPFSYLPPPSPGATSPTGGTSSTSSNGSNDLNNSSINNPISNGLDTDNVPKKNGTTTSIIDLLYALAYGTSSTDAQEPVSTGTPVKLNDSLQNVATINGEPSNTQANTPVSPYNLGTGVSQTFTSNDLSKNPSLQNFTSTNSTFALLENMRLILLSLLDVLKPFGGNYKPPANSVTSPGME